MTRGERNIAWIENRCRLPDGKRVGHPVTLAPFQHDILRGIYDTPTRLAIISMGRKAGKTSLSALLTLLHMVGPEARANSNLYSDAQSVEQAALLYRYAAKIVRLSPDLRPYVIPRDSIKELFCPELGTTYKALSAEAKTSYGLNPAIIVHDELGQVRGPRSELYEALETATATQEDPLSIIISTQAPNDSDLLSVLIDDAKKGVDPKVKLFLWTADEDLDPFAEVTIRQANPAYDHFMNQAEVRAMAEAARRMPSREAAYRNLILNQRIDATAPLIARPVWTACGGEIDPEAFKGAVYVGLDLSARNDLTALVAIAEKDGMWHVQPTFFVPEIGLADRALRDRQPYDLWARDEFLIATPGASVDYEWVAVRLCELADTCDLKAVAFDRWRIDLLKAELAKMGRELPLIPYGQGFKDMAPAVDALEAELLGGKIRHGNHPVLTWCAANAVAVRDPAGNRKVDKVRSSGRIDGIVALLMALGVRTMTEPVEYVEGRLVAL